MVRLLVCLQCRRGEGDALRDALEERRNPRLNVVGTRCLGMCDRGCLVALQSPGRNALIVGDLHREHAGPIVILAQRYASSDHGWVAPADRPDALRRQVLLRLPPV